MARHARDPRLERFWREHFKQQAASGLSVRVYCRRHALKEPTFYAWRRIIAARDAAVTPATMRVKPSPPRTTPAFLPVAVVGSPATTPAPSPIEICLTSGRRVRVRSGCDRQLLTTVLAVLEEARC
jgi:hypothetical protein